MIKLTVLPLIWLGFFVLGRFSDGKDIEFRRWLFALVSIGLLVLSVGPASTLLFLSAATPFVLVSLYLSASTENAVRRQLFVATLIAAAVMVIAYLLLREKIGRYFVYLPSLSYLGFCVIAMVVSAYRCRNVTLSAGLLQVALLPTVFLGPITRVENFLSCHRDHERVLERLAIGLTMLTGAHFAGELIPDVKTPDVLHTADYWLGAVAISFEFYFTFAGYSHLIIALCLLAGFRIEENFNNPYLATSITAFWRRWHRSLSFWIRDYLYIPLGGNRRGITLKCLNLLFCMCVVGLWHGIALNYLAWGLMHGLALSFEAILRHHDIKPVTCAFGRYAPVVQIPLTFAFVTASWIVFSYDLGTAIEFGARLINLE